ncbi:hypothetical protein MNB_SV-13-1954 [hydrothermal vent metagenome]|uniref:Uncharacterized protein n=1 Tax=hydrothermal vent metagenome TaxID=652676 RepID=A0A1W1BM37_9ZZZZ
MYHYDRASDFNLEEGVEYLEIRANVVYPWKKSHRVLFSTDKTYMSKMSQTLQETLNALAPIDNRENNLYLEHKRNSSSCRIVYNAVIVTNKDKIYKMNTIQDIRSVLGTIDTEGEIALLLWLHDYENTLEQYRRTFQGFEATGWYQPMIGEAQKCTNREYKRYFDRNMNFVMEVELRKEKSNITCVRWMPPTLLECR